MQIDKKQTIKNVKNFFNYEYPKLLTMSNINLTFISSPKIDGLPNRTTNSNVQEIKIVNTLNANDVVTGVKKLVNACPPNFKTILKVRYLQGQSMTTTMAAVGYESTRYHELQNEALLYFADVFIDFYELHAFIE